MRKIREVLRLRFEAGLSIRQISQCSKSSVGAVQKVVSQATRHGLSWPLPAGMDDGQLARLFYPDSDTQVSARLQQPDWSEVHQELKGKGVTKLLLWDDCMDAGGRTTQEHLSRNTPHNILIAVIAIPSSVPVISNG